MNNIFKHCIIGCLFLLVIWVPPGKSYATGVHEYAMWLKQGETFHLERYLSAGETMIAGCSEDCFDVDLILYDATTKSAIHKDIKDNTSPKVTAPEDGDYWVELSMANCALNRGCKAWLDLAEDETS